MFHLQNSLRYFLYPLPVDMHKSFYTLSGIVTSTMNQNISDGGVFIFMDRNQNVMKILHMEYAGLVILEKTEPLTSIFRNILTTQFDS